MVAPPRSRQAYLKALGIDCWVLRDSPSGQPQVETPLPPESENHQQSSPDLPGEQPDWTQLQRQVAACTRCELHRSRTQTVFGVGNRQAEWLIIGEAPGADEDAQGEPFVGRAGQLLNAMLQAAGKPRETVYIANILKCRPPGNRDPRPEEVAQCRPYLRRQIELLNPKIILAVGRIAAQNLLESEEPISRLRGKTHRLPGFDIPIVVTYHPAYLLRKPADKSKAWDDLQLACFAFKESGL
ncbi:MAG TPA: uracil-DNA glycosylase [Gammaproteobacteria bacterium]